MFRWIGRGCVIAVMSVLLGTPVSVHASMRQEPSAAAQAQRGGEANLILPDLRSAELGGFDARGLLFLGLGVCAVGLLFGLLAARRLKRLPVHPAMLEVSELIYDTCKTYLIRQGRFILLLECFVGVIIALYYSALPGFPLWRVAIILAFSLVGIAGSYSVAWFGIRVNTFANSRMAFASLKATPYPLHAIPLGAGMSIGMLLISVELMIMLCILLFIPRDLAGSCFIGFAIGESLAASALRIAGGIFTKIADIGADLMKIVFNVKEDDARNPGVIADCVGDNAGDSVGPSADGFETYGVTGVALITFILAAIPGEDIQLQLLVWIFVIRIVMIGASGLSYLVNDLIAREWFSGKADPDFEVPLTVLVWLTSATSIVLTYGISYLLIPDLGDGTMWWKLATIISCGTLAGAMIPEIVKAFTSTKAAHVSEVVEASREGGPSLNILAGLVAGNFSAYWLGLCIVSLMGVAHLVATDFQGMMLAPSVFAFGLVAFGFLGMGPVTIAVDSYGPVTDNAQSVFELSVLENQPGAAEAIRRDYGFSPDFASAKHLLEKNDGAGNTFKATAKPVLIGTAIVGATTMTFSIVVLLTAGLTQNVSSLSILHAPFLLGLITGGAVIYWFTGASTQAVTAGAYRAVAFIKANMKLEGGAKASAADSKRVVEICTQYAQLGMFNIFLTVFFSTMAFAFLEPYFFIGYLIAMALFGLFQAIFMANAGGAWDNAKKIVEVDLREKGTPLHAAMVIGDTVGDPFKDTSSVAMNPLIKFTTLFGLLAVELAVEVAATHGVGVTYALSLTFMLASLVFAWRSFYRMRIQGASTR